MKVIKKIEIQAFCMASFPKPMTIELPSKKLKISTNNCVKDIFSFTISNLIPFKITTVSFRPLSDWYNLLHYMVCFLRFFFMILISIIMADRKPIANVHVEDDSAN